MSNENIPWSFYMGMLVSGVLLAPFGIGVLILCITAVSLIKRLCGGSGRID